MGHPIATSLSPDAATCRAVKVEEPSFLDYKEGLRMNWPFKYLSSDILAHNPQTSWHIILKHLGLLNTYPHLSLSFSLSPHPISISPLLAPIRFFLFSTFSTNFLFMNCPRYLEPWFLCKI
ncbi:hypothetical protein PRUPE_5G004700 [Prunus persica]|uniref:Uncharacterized protein n=1 Tax=Prunus persica TaxID=3760 RepID=M5WB48_PRUPE|nr:hypothetical protein PRUPE_5G004700 [Prunus persica]